MFYKSENYPCATFCALTFKQKLCCATVLVVTVRFGGLTETRDTGREGRDREKERGRRVVGNLHPPRASLMKHRSPSGQQHGKRSRVPVASASFSDEPTMEDKGHANPRELTQNPLKKIWMPCKNGLPEKHISQRKGAYGNVAALTSVTFNRRRTNGYL